MRKVFIGGSRRVSRLHADVRRRLDRIVEKRLPVLAGDANGADKAHQGPIDGGRSRRRVHGLGRKQVVVHVVPAKRFVELKSRPDWEACVSGCTSDLRRRIEREATAEQLTGRAPAQADLL